MRRSRFVIILGLRYYIASAEVVEGSREREERRQDRAGTGSDRGRGETGGHARWSPHFGVEAYIMGGSAMKMIV